MNKYSHRLFIFIVVPLMLGFNACKEDESPVASEEQMQALYSQNDANKQIVETIGTLFSTGLNAVFTDTALPTYDKADFCKNFTHSALFFDSEDGYVAVEGSDGITISNPKNQQVEGTSILDMKDADGNEFVQKMIDIARFSDYGFYTYNLENPSSKQVEKYTTFVKSVSEINGYLRTGFFNSSSEKLQSPNEVNQEIVRNAVQAMAKGLGGILTAHAGDSMEGVQLVRSFLRHIRYFDNQSGYFYVIDFNGYNIAQPPNPAIQGTYEYDLQDSKGNYLVRGLIETAQSGGGFYEYYWVNYQTNKDDLKKAYVTQIPGTNYLIGSGVYLTE